MTFEERYEKLNPAQQQAVDMIDGPLLVIAGPGTGKTELLSMRAANILRKTDTLPDNLLLLTFTDSGANAMRERLAEIMGPEAYKVAIHTFHSFGSEAINHHREYFYSGATMQPADDIASHEILLKLFDELDYSNILASKWNGEYTYLRDTKQIISELKSSGLTSDELLAILSDDELVLDLVEQDLSDIFSAKISTTMLARLVPLAERVATHAETALPPGITPLANVLALSMAHAFDEAVATGKTNSITAWRDAWLEKNSIGVFVFKDRKRIAKLRAVASIYYLYLAHMNEAGLYDYDDMVLGLVHALETQDDLRYNLQEKYQYIMVDEFQDTNLAQLRILFNLTNNPASEGRPNIMAVGDDDQAIYSFQGADVNNIHRFRDQFPSHEIIVLTDNYRSGATILEKSRNIITQGGGRLEDTIDFVDKSLTAHHQTSSVAVVEHPSPIDERTWIAHEIKSRVDEGAKPESIVVLSRRHQELVALAPHIERQGLNVNYERRDNVLDDELVDLVLAISSIVTSLWEDGEQDADSMIPELLAHPALAIEAEMIWRLSLDAHKNHQTLIETMLTYITLAPIANWLLELRKLIDTTQLELILDTIIGAPDAEVVADFRSPLYNYYFSPENLEKNPARYIEFLESLRTLRTRLRDYHTHEKLYLQDLLDFIRLHEEMNLGITTIRKRSDTLTGSVNLMTAHKAKGLEFDHVFILNAVDSTWGERVRSHSRLISYPENLELAPAGDSYDERLRLFYVAMTRAKRELVISYSSADILGKATLPAGFLTDLTEVHTVEPLTIEQEQAALTADWRVSLTDHPTQSMQALIRPMLENYRLSVTHLNAFLDITRGGPQQFLLHNLLRFPQAKSANARFGTAVHATLQRAHSNLSATGVKRPVEDIIHDFEHELDAQRLDARDHVQYLSRGIAALTKFLEASYGSFSQSQKTELSFAAQGVTIGDARLTGSLDLVDIVDKSIRITDYKTGIPSRDWKGKTDYERIKLHKYRQQLMFYQLLAEHSRDYANYRFDGAVLQFIEPDATGTIHALETSFTNEELNEFRALISAVWRLIISLDLPDISNYEPNLKGILAFEHDLIDRYKSLG